MIKVLKESEVGNYTIFDFNGQEIKTNYILNSQVIASIQDIEVVKAMLDYINLISENEVMDLFFDTYNYLVECGYSDYEASNLAGMELADDYLLYLAELALDEYDVQYGELIVDQAIEKGMTIEKEHSFNPDIQYTICIEHLKEDFHYYEKLKGIE